MSPPQLRELLRYEPETGKLFWLPRTPESFGSPFYTARRCAAWNAIYAGEEALNRNHNQGYRAGAILNRTYLAHRVVWAFVHGQWPEDEIDHLDGCRSNNRIGNLRTVSRCDNMRNRQLSTKNTSGVMGVYWAPHAKKWRAEIKTDEARIHLGYFNDKALAVAARKAAERGQGFHPNHGRARA